MSATGSWNAPDTPAEDRSFMGRVGDRVEGWLERASEYLNPILVKEARQALKSRQFVTTFSLLLLCGWGWSIIGIVSQQGAAYYSARGDMMLAGYYFVLAIPLLLVVPLSAYRSLVNEREDGTFELVSVSTLTARQIITGKLGSAILQMLIYYSAISPCLAFSYMLRGVDILTIFSVLTYTFLVSVFLAVFALFMATVTLSRHWQTLMTVALIAGQVFVIWGWSALILGLYLEDDLPYDDELFWAVNLALVCLYASYLALLLVCSSAKLSFASDNRTTKIRIILTLQSVAFMGWSHYFWDVAEREFLFGMITVGIFHWFLMGSLIIGERGEMSPRIRRSLPTTNRGKALATWYLPGSGTGFMFVIGNMLAMVFYLLGHLVFSSVTRTSFLSSGTVACFFILLASYFIIYLGLARLMVVNLRAFAPVGMSFSLLACIFVIGSCVAGPYLLDYWWNDYRFPNFGPIQIPNGVWSINEFMENNRGITWDANTWNFSPIYFSVPLAALFIFWLNLFSVRTELERTRVVTPRRVVADNEEMTSRPESEPVDPLA